MAVLGPVAIATDEGAMTALRGNLPQALLIALVLARGRPVSSATLADDLWPDSPPFSPRSALQTLVSRVRGLSDDALIESTPVGYRLVAPTDLDVAEDLAAQARAAMAAGQPDDAAALAQHGLTLWRGEPGGADNDLTRALRVRATEIQDRLDGIWLEAQGARGHLGAALPRAEARAARLPADEHAHLVLMRAYADAGRVNDALRVFAHIRDVVADELGVSPGAALVDLNAALLGVRESGAGAAPTSTSPSPQGRGERGTLRRTVGLRSAPNELLGRADDVAAVTSAVARARLVTVLGTGGLGKTRLAQEVARTASSTTPRVVVVELASIRTDEDVALALASALGVREEPTVQRLGDRIVRTDIATRVVERLIESPTLLVLDNCEHVIDGVAQWATELLAATSAVRILATSRSPLAVAGEHLHQLSPLPSRVDGAPGPATELFVERAQAVRPAAQLPLDVVERLCERLDGLPLAIELAAARVRTMSVEEIEDRLTARFDLLTAGDRAAPPRHRTLQAVIEWSWDLLDKTEHAVLSRLSVFPGSFDSVGARVVGGLSEAATYRPSDFAVIDAVDGLVKQSLLVVIDDPASAIVRFRMLETVREFSALKLAEAGEGGAAQEALYAWAVSLARQHTGALTGATQTAALEATHLDQENLIHAVRLALGARRGDVLIPVFALLAIFWTLRGAHSDVESLGADVVDALTGDIPSADADAAALVYIVVAATFLATASRSARRAVGRLRRLTRARGLLSGQTQELGVLLLASMAAASPDLAVSGAAMTAARSSSYPFVAAIAHIVSAQVAENGGDFAQARHYSQAAYDIARADGDVWGASTTAQLLAQLASGQAEPETALRWIAIAREGLTTIQAEVDLHQLRWLEAANLSALGDYDQAAALFASLGSASGDEGGQPESEELRVIALAGQAEIAFLRGGLHEAAALYATGLAPSGTMGGRRSPWAALFLSGALSVAVLAGDPGAPDLAATLRATVLAAHRLPRPFVDFPVLGTHAIALGSYLVHAPELDRVDDGMRLLALARRMGSRQDLPSLRLEVHDGAARHLHGESRVEAARTVVDAMAQEELLAHVVTILRARPWHG